MNLVFVGKEIAHSRFGRLLECVLVDTGSEISECEVVHKIHEKDVISMTDRIIAGEIVVQVSNVVVDADRHVCLRSLMVVEGVVEEYCR